MTFFLCSWLHVVDPMWDLLFLLPGCLQAIWLVGLFVLCCGSGLLVVPGAYLSVCVWWIIFLPVNTEGLLS